ncbi:hypothetical protein DESUT3_17030 [Desulfuromonas versatilis]|uniref:histidine kinase n=1 Tax=Desulfuromonas versatilis TaxID=2802975 RepID=A0ABM8HVC7_9BACT|nr:ATP-binding protein [Desulfuromonas versatilis]BCR04634.1 hypothetical protein DESUT3_17030 [Desulfuromonas versatilis]
MPKTIGLRTEILVNIALLLGAALLFAGFLLLKLAERELVSQQILHSGNLLQVLAGALDDGSGDRGLTSRVLPERLKGLLGHLPAGSAPEGWELVGSDLGALAAVAPEAISLAKSSDLDRVRLSGEPSIRVQYPSAWFQAGPAEPGFVLITVPLLRGGEFQGALRAKFSLEPVRDRLAAARGLVLVYVALYGAVLVLFGIYLLGRNVVRPVRRLMEMTRVVAAGDLEQSLPVEGPREIAELAGSFNAMVAALKASRSETEAHIESLRQANEDLRRTRAELVRSEKLASVGHLAAGMAHEIGNPLGAVVGYLEFLKTELPPGEQREIVERSLAESGRIDRLVKDLLDYAAPGPGEATLVDPAEILAEALDMLTHQGAFKHQRIGNHLPATLVPVRAARHKLLQVFVNLLLNAKDACGDGGTIRVSAQQEGSWAKLEVADDGCGMGPEVLRNVFDPFFTTKAPGKGRGLGLSVCHRVIEEAGGRIEVNSKPGEGSVFTVFLKTEEADGHER